ncbi:MAG: response regulator transcription factor [Lachnospiraceae bacterium]|nr:response regulator transcription factor [Lachnospiraceae bacterium]MDD3659643.1 response regulator transcription factor [Lachnospiraceae bacterium]
MFTILVVEDDKNTRRLMQAILTANGYHIHLASNGIEALEIMDSHHIDLMILDIMMPEMDGYELTKVLRSSNYNLPILMVSAKILPEDKRKGFIVGTDDYMTKPVDEEEMLLRIQALLRRAKIASEHQLIVGDVFLDYDALTVSTKEESMLLPQKEFLLLYKLLSYPDKIFTRIQLMDEIWGMDTETSDSTVTVHINRLRKRFEHYPEFEIETVRGLGYKVSKHV